MQAAQGAAQRTHPAVAHRQVSIVHADLHPQVVQPVVRPQLCQGSAQRLRCLRGCTSGFRPTEPGIARHSQAQALDMRRRPPQQPLAEGLHARLAGGRIVWQAIVYGLQQRGAGRQPPPAPPAPAHQRRPALPAWGSGGRWLSNLVMLAGVALCLPAGSLAASPSPTCFADPAGREWQSPARLAVPPAGPRRRGWDPQATVDPCFCLLALLLLAALGFQGRQAGRVKGCILVWG